MIPHKHHIIPRYKCKELGIEPDFDDNLVDVTREQHALIHWGYKCNDLSPLLEVCNPPQNIIDMIPLGDNRDSGAASILALGEIDGVDTFGENNPNWKGGISLDSKAYEETPERIASRRKRQSTPEYKKKARISNIRFEETPKRRAYKKKYDAERRTRKKLEKQQGVSTLEKFL